MTDAAAPGPNIFAFVLMPFAPSFDDVYRIGIKEPAESMGIRAERVDEQIYAEGMLERVYRQIDAADLIIADMSGQNPNVFYEVGYAHAKDKLCILLTRDASDIPFDLKHRRHIIYGNSIRSLREQLMKDLSWAQGHIDSARRSRIRVAVKHITGFLDKDEWGATAQISFLIDLHNDSDVPSAEIETIYVYTTEHWRVIQSGENCPVTDSDVPTFKRRHFLRTPLKRLPRSGWAQLAFRADRVMALTFNGEETKDSYHIKGYALLRLVTDKGTFDHTMPINTVADVIPF